MSKEQEFVGLLNKEMEELVDNYAKRRIADLEAKLAESEEYNEMLLEEKSGYIDLISGYSKKCKSYEQQLTEKEKERELDNAFWKQECDSLQKALAEKEKEIERLNYKLEEIDNNFIDWQQADQAKTDFAIEQLERAKEFIKEKYTYDVEESDWAVVYELDIDEIFDQQIKELKEGK